MSSKPVVKVRRWTKQDIPGIIECHKAAYPDYPAESHFGKRLHELQLAAFPEGQFLAEIKGRIVGYATSIIVQLEDDENWYTWNEITGSGTFSTHDPDGDTLYGSDIAVHPDFRGIGIAGQLYKARKKLLKTYNLKRMVAYGRIPGYQDYAGEMTPEEYVSAVQRGELKDSALSAHLKAGYEPKRILFDYMSDRSSLNYCTVIEMPNPDFRPERRRIATVPIKRPLRRIRVCASQYLMRRIQSWDEFEKTVDFFVDTADSYHSHFLVLPELFTAQLFSILPPGFDDRQAIRELAGMASQYRELLSSRARDRNLYIIGGSHPIIREDKVYNVAHVFTPGGQIHTQDKLHITRSERQVWDVQPGKGLKLFDTPRGRFAVLVCYDIEFPELSRLLAGMGVEVIFVPFSTDEKKSYFRVRYCAQSRAVENYIYVVLSGNVGTLPAVRPYLINYGQAGIYTPSDFSFPLEAKLAEAEPNIETVVISEIDLGSLNQQRHVGSVRPLQDRRTDLYELSAKITVELIHAE
ncbi:MAG TPA: bifunctional GNAT family N-acetyltransferase/carbon-nitrogen hydrolase family protein [Vicinamibacteria bacterium]|nr:bifunctional GNAT family N-acetyltransferase/carbon-nitrogen hydrolase family protein [Vicinamibacteria bacterium]